MRNTFINTLVDLASVHQDVFLICGDLGYSVLEPFAEKFPDRFLNVGIAEQNMTGVATGLAREGYNVFTYSIGNFPTLRCMEQIRYDVCYHNANVKIIAVGAGYAYGPLGASHHTTEDIAMLRSIPNMLVTSPADAIEAAAIAQLLCTHSGPGYVRINKSGETNIHCSPIKLEIGDMLTIKNGQHILVASTGAITEAIAREIEREKLPFSLVSFPFISSLNRRELIRLLGKHEQIITVEEHQLNGGFGSALIEEISDLYSLNLISQMPKVHRLAIPNKFISFAGSQHYLRQIAGINLAQVLPRLDA
jgi:transketolase